MTRESPGNDDSRITYHWRKDEIVRGLGLALRLLLGFLQLQDTVLSIGSIARRIASNCPKFQTGNMFHLFGKCQPSVRFQRCFAAQGGVIVCHFDSKGSGCPNFQGPCLSGLGAAPGLILAGQRREYSLKALKTDKNNQFLVATCSGPQRASKGDVCNHQSSDSRYRLKIDSTSSQSGKIS